MLPSLWMATIAWQTAGLEVVRWPSRRDVEYTSRVKANRERRRGKIVTYLAFPVKIWQRANPRKFKP